MAFGGHYVRYPSLKKVVFLLCLGLFFSSVLHMSLLVMYCFILPAILLSISAPWNMSVHTKCLNFYTTLSWPNLEDDAHCTCPLHDQLLWSVLLCHQFGCTLCQGLTRLYIPIHPTSSLLTTNVCNFAQFPNIHILYRFMYSNSINHSDRKDGEHVVQEIQACSRQAFEQCN